MDIVYGVEWCDRQPVSAYPRELTDCYNCPRASGEFTGHSYWKCGECCEASYIRDDHDGMTRARTTEFASDSDFDRDSD